MAGFRIVNEPATPEKRVVIFETEVPNEEARLAFTLIERGYLGSKRASTNDSAGRARYDLLTPAEMVTRAFETAKLAFVAARTGGLFVDVPDLNTLNDPPA